MYKITPFLWLNNNVEEAVHFYTSIFKNSKIESLSSQSATFELEGQRFMALNGGPLFKFTEAISLFVDCTTQQEVDTLWAKLTADGGEESRCGWLKDKYGLSWQIVPSILLPLLSHPDPVKAKRVLQAMLKMKKLNIAKLQAAAK